MKRGQDLLSEATTNLDNAAVYEVLVPAFSQHAEKVLPLLCQRTESECFQRNVDILVAWVDSCRGEQFLLLGREALEACDESFFFP